MALVFKKKHTGCGGSVSKWEFSVLVSPYRRTSDIDSLLIRLSAELLDRAGWQVGDRCIVQYDRGVWTLTRTTNPREGYKLSRSEKTKSRIANVKLSLSKDEQVELGMKRGDRFEANAIEANGQRIVAAASN
jgi:hypothetical protein